MAATFSPELVQEMGEVTATEARAMYHALGKHDRFERRVPPKRLLEQLHAVAEVFAARAAIGAGGVQLSDVPSSARKISSWIDDGRI